MNIVAVSPRCLEAVQSHESFSDHQYDDGTGVMTIGYGTTAADVQPLPTHITQQAAAELLADRLNRKYLPPVMRALKPLNPTRNMVEACVSFAYNLGVGAFEGVPGFETLTRALAAHDRQAVADALLLYDDPNNPKVHEGLKLRREAERAWFLEAEGAPVDPFAGYPPEEAKAIHEYDHLLHAKDDLARVQALRAWMIERRDEIHRAAQPRAQGGDGRGWTNLRKQRFKSLSARTS